MRKIGFKQKILMFFGSVALAATLIVSACIFGLPNKALQGESQAAVRYADSSAIIKPLIEDKTSPNSTYNMMSYYPIYVENQTKSNLCWAYAASKVLETSLMVQRNEYHNFSETAVALIKYFNDDGSAINSTGNFEGFNLIAQTVGIVHENDFSNDIYFNLNETNARNYEFVLDLVDTNFMNNVLPISISGNSQFASLTDETQKADVIKKYIVKYGGIFTGLEWGTILNDDSTYYPKTISDSETDNYFSESHAVCIIGWDNYRGFLAINSWGQGDKNFSTFYIPFNYQEMYKTFYGYISTGEREEVSLKKNEDGTLATSASQFAGNVMTANTAKQLSNMFVSGEKIELTYKIAEKFDFEEIFVSIYSGRAVVTQEFKLDFSIDHELTISSRDENLNSYNSGYLIKFYAGDKPIAVYDFYVFTGTEISYVELVKKAAPDVTDSIQIKNNLSTGETSATYYVSSGGSNDVFFYIDIYLPIPSYVSTVEKTLSNIYQTTTSSGTINRQTISSVSASVSSMYFGLNSSQNRLRINIENLTKNNAGKMIDFSITLRSTLGYEKVYNFMFFISKNTMVNSTSSNTIVYDMDGGKNAEENIQRYPNYSLESSMTSFELKTPEKYNSNFLGWFTDSEFKNQITEIDSSFSGDIVIYAKWESDTTNYFDVDFEIASIIGYGETSSSLYGGESKIIYGDSLNFKFTYTPSDKINQDYYTRYRYFLNDIEVSTKTLAKAEELDFSANFPELVCGNYVASVETTMVIGRSFSVSKTVSVEFEVYQKEVTAKFTDLVYTYDRQYHQPTVTLNGVYKEDTNVLMTVVDDKNNTSEIDVGNYTFTLKSVSNPNYKIADNQTGTLIINRASVGLQFNSSEFVYNGSSQTPVCTVTGIGSDIVEVDLKFFKDNNEILYSDCKNVGSYMVRVSLANSKNYLISSGSTDFNFKIVPANLTITFTDIAIRLSVASNNRPSVSYTVSGLVGADTESDLGVTYSCAALTASKAGKYPITGSCNNSNYTATIVDGTYTLYGFYYIYYTLPDGTTYTELVNEDETPIGITRKIYKRSIFSSISYSEDLVSADGSNLFVVVTVKNYTWVVIVAVIVVAIIAVYLFTTRKTRRMKNR